jgi:hypothetical protein
MERSEAALRIAEMALAKALEALEYAKLKGDKGDKGDRGEPGRDGVTTQKVAAYQGVWAEKEFSLGDFVTWGGSLWHCNVDKTGTKPGDGGTDWQLAVKRGRDGKDGKDGPRGPDGVPGRDGKDRLRPWGDGDGNA